MTTHISDNAPAAAPEEDRPFRAAWRRFAKNRLALLGLFMTVSVVLAAVFADRLASHDPLKQLVWSQGAKAKLAAPSPAHPMGTDLYGRDILSRVLHGARISLQIGFFATLVTLVVGVPLGAIAGYRGGWADALISWLVNVVFAFPFLLFVLAIVSVFRDPGLHIVFLAIGLVNWVGICRVTRAQFIALRGREFVEAARALGLPNRRIVWRHILPNAIAPIIVQATMGMGAVIAIEAGLAYLGFGAQPPTPSWGLMISEGQRHLSQGRWWWSVFPGLAIMYTVLAFNFLGDGLQDAFGSSAED